MKYLALLFCCMVLPRAGPIHGVNIRSQDWRQVNLRALSMIRLRWQMDAIRLEGPVKDVALLQRICRDAEIVGLMTVYTPGLEGLMIHSPAVQFEAATAEQAISLRKRGAKGAILVPVAFRSQLPPGDWQFTVASGFETDTVDDDRDQHFAGQNLVVTSWGLDLTRDNKACHAAPNDPEDAEELVLNALDYFAEHRISWYANFFAPGWLIQEFTHYEPTVLFGPWTCGQTDLRRGMGEVVQYHRWGIREGEVVAVGPSGAPQSAPGAMTILYGSQIENGMKVWVADQTGERTSARIAHRSKGQINFEMPARVKPGGVKITLEPGGYQSRIEILPVVPAVWTRSKNAQGEAVASRRGNMLILHGSGMHAARQAILIANGKQYRALEVGVEPGIPWNDEVRFGSDLPVHGEAVLRVGKLTSNAFVLP